MGILNIIKNLFKTQNSSASDEINILSTGVPVITADFSQSYAPSLAENSKFVVAKTEDPIFSGYPSDGFGKFVTLNYVVNELNAVDFSQGYSPSQAENGKFVELKLDPSLGWPVTNYPKYATLSYIVNPSWLSVSGGQLLSDLDMNGFDILNVNTIYAVSAITTYIDNITGDVLINGDATVENDVTIGGFLSAGCGNSEQWCSVYTQVNSNSGTWEGNFCNKIVNLSSVSACGGIIEIDGSLQFTATSNFIDMSDASITDIHSLQFNTSHDHDPILGELSWNLEDGTLNIGMNSGDVVLQVGQEIHYRVKNGTDSDIGNGIVVQALSAQALGNSGTILVAPATADGTFPSKYILGLATQIISAGSLGYVTHFGKVRGVDTSNYPVGTILYADPTTAGAMVSAEPEAPNNKATIAITLSQKSNGVVFVRPSYGSNLRDDESIYYGSPTNGNILTYNSVSGIWVTSEYNVTDFTPTARPIETETVTTFTIDTSSNVILVDATAGNTTANLPNAVGNTGKTFTIKKIDSTANTVTLSANTNIDGQSTFIINNQYDAIEFISDNVQWWII